MLHRALVKVKYAHISWLFLCTTGNILNVFPIMRRGGGSAKAVAYTEYNWNIVLCLYSLELVIWMQKCVRSTANNWPFSDDQYQQPSVCYWQAQPGGPLQASLSSKSTSHIMHVYTYFFTRDPLRLIPDMSDPSRTPSSTSTTAT